MCVCVCVCHILIYNIQYIESIGELILQLTNWTFDHVKRMQMNKVFIPYYIHFTRIRKKHFVVHFFLPPHHRSHCMLCKAFVLIVYSCRDQMNSTILAIFGRVNSGFIVPSQHFAWSTLSNLCVYYAYVLSLPRMHKHISRTCAYRSPLSNFLKTFILCSRGVSFDLFNVRLFIQPKEYTILIIITLNQTR